MNIEHSSLLNIKSYFLKYRKFLRVFVSWNIRSFFGVFVSWNMRKAFFWEEKWTFLEVSLFSSIKRFSWDGFFLVLWVWKVHFLKYKKLFRVFLLCNMRKFHFLKYKKSEPEIFESESFHFSKIIENKINEHNRRQTRLLSLIINYFGMYF